MRGAHRHARSTRDATSWRATVVHGLGFALVVSATLSQKGRSSVGSPRMSGGVNLGGASLSRRRRRVLIWQSRNLPTLPFMYSPVTDFLLAAFAPHVAWVARGAGTKRNDSAAFIGNWTQLREGDIFVWVGWAMDQAPWLAMVIVSVSAGSR